MPFDAEPEDWRQARLSDLVRITTAGISANDLASKPQVYHYSLPAFDSGLGPELVNGNTIRSNKSLVQSDCILFSKLNPRIPRIWRVAQTLSDDSFCSTEFWPLAQISKDIDLDYLTFFLSSPAFLGDSAIAPSSSTNSHQRVDRQSFESFVLPLPPLDEQRRIAEVLRSVDEVVARSKDSLRAASRLRQSLLATHCHRGDWQPERPIPSGWKLVRLDDVAQRGSGHTPNKKVAAYWSGDIKWVSLQDTRKLDKVYVSETAESITQEGLDNSSAVLHPPGTVVLSRDATVGRSAIAANEVAVSQHFMAYRCGPQINKLYLYYWFQFMKPIFERIGAGSTIKTIGLPFFKALHIVLPPVEEQTRLAEEMLSIDTLVISDTAALGRAKCLKTTLAAELLSGRVRVPA